MNNKIKEAVNTARNNEAIFTLIQGDVCAESILHAAVDYRVGRMNALRARETITPGEDAIYIQEMNAAVKMYNSLVVEEHLNKLKTMSEKDAFKAYLKDQSAKGLRVFLDAKTNRYEVGESSVTVRFYDFLSVIRPVEVAGIMDAIAIFIDNIARNDCHDDGAYVSKHSLHLDYINLRHRLGWVCKKAQDGSDNISNMELLRQLNELVNAFILPKEMEQIKMIGADLRYIRVAAIQAVDKVNMPGLYQQRNDETLCGFIFRAIYTRVNSLAYEFQKTRAQDKGTYKSYPQTTQEYKQDKARTETPKEGGPVSVSTSEEAATAMKKESDQ